jgi:hypothetical protein
MTTLHVVTDEEAQQRRAYVIGVDSLDFASTVCSLEDDGYIVINAEEDRLVDEVPLRDHLMGLAFADDLVIPMIWWTSYTAHQLVQIAGWMKMPMLNDQGIAIETVSMGGGR